MATDTLKDLKATLQTDIAAFNIKSLKDADAFIAKESVGATDATLTRHMAVIAYGIGKLAKASDKNEKPNVEKQYVALQDRMRAPGLGRKAELTKSTRETMVSYNNAIAELGAAKWDSFDAFAWCLDKIKGQYSFRGKVIRQIANLADQPTDERMAEILAEATKAPTLGAKAKAMAKGIRGIAGLFKDSGLPADQKMALLALVRAADNLATITAGGGDDDTSWLAEAA